jgi:small-conductance mechanosensitive channel
VPVYSPERLHQVALTAETQSATVQALEARLRGRLMQRRAAAAEALRLTIDEARSTEEQRSLRRAALAKVDAEIAAVTAELARMGTPAAQAQRLLGACRDWITRTRATAR